MACKCIAGEATLKCTHDVWGNPLVSMLASCIGTAAEAMVDCWCGSGALAGGWGWCARRGGGTGRDSDV